MARDPNGNQALRAMFDKTPATPAAPDPADAAEDTTLADLAAAAQQLADGLAKLVADDADDTPATTPKKATTP